MKDNKKPDMETLCPDTEVEGYNIRPWGLKEITQLLPILARLKADVTEKNITLESFVEMAPGNILDFAAILSPYIVDIMAITLKAPREEIEAFDLEKTILILTKIMDQNVSYLKNCFGLVSRKIELMKLESLERSNT